MAWQGRFYWTTTTGRPNLFLLFSHLISKGHHGGSYQSTVHRDIRPFQTQSSSTTTTKTATHFSFSHIKVLWKRKRKKQIFISAFRVAALNRTRTWKGTSNVWRTAVTGDWFLPLHFKCSMQHRWDYANGSRCTVSLLSSSRRRSMYRRTNQARDRSPLLLPISVHTRKNWSHFTCWSYNTHRANAQGTAFENVLINILRPAERLEKKKIPSSVNRERKKFFNVPPRVHWNTFDVDSIGIIQLFLS